MPVRLKDSPKTQRMRIQHAEFLGNTTTLVLIHENDIYIRQSPADEEDIRLTSTGVPGLIYNGVTDWLYQGMMVLLGPFNYKFIYYVYVIKKYCNNFIYFFLCSSSIKIFQQRNF